MSAAVVIPSINAAPRMVAFLRDTEPDALVIVVGDRKAPPELREFCKQYRALYLGVEEQEHLLFFSKMFIPWNCIMRRNLGVLEAVRLGADIIISMDDDNLPGQSGHVSRFARLLDGPITAQCVTTRTGWFNLGDMASPRFHYRGYPYSQRKERGEHILWGCTAPVGIANGLIYSDPDINAASRIEKPTSVYGYSEVALDGLMVDPSETWTAINTQNTAYRKELRSLAFALPGVGRYDDIWALYIAQRVMMATDYKVYFGPPSVTQERNEHNLFRDLENELYGMQHTEAFCDVLGGIEVLPRYSPLDNLDRIAEGLRERWDKPFPHEFLRAWIDDMGKLL